MTTAMKRTTIDGLTYVLAVRPWDGLLALKGHGIDWPLPEGVTLTRPDLRDHCRRAIDQFQQNRQAVRKAQR